MPSSPSAAGRTHQRNKLHIPPHYLLTGKLTPKAKPPKLRRQIKYGRSLKLSASNRKASSQRTQNQPHLPSSHRNA
ncbi:MAG: hypothetical protein NZM04_10480 [Methylacidiphilales bacterium]|nr:hypothetical protein [Candidatus Methylacidiphilales bacterium]